MSAPGADLSDFLTVINLDVEEMPPLMELMNNDVFFSRSGIYSAGRL